MNKQNAVVARNYATEKYADTIIDNTNSLRNDAVNDADDAYSYSMRDDKARRNKYDGRQSHLNNKIINAGGEYAYVTNAGVARPISGGIEGNWSTPSDVDNEYTKFNKVPYSNCPSSITNLNEYDGLSDINVDSKYANIYTGDSINNYELTACGSEGDIVYINKFMTFGFYKIGGNTRWHVGTGEGFTFLDIWNTGDWKGVAPLAAKLACDSGYKTIKLMIANMRGKTVVICSASDVDAPAGLSTNYSTSRGGNKSTVSGNCNNNNLKWPKRTINKTNSEVVNGLPLLNFRSNSPQKYKRTKGKHPVTKPVKCTHFVDFTQPYNIICNEMSIYPERVPSGLQRCNAIYTVWYPGITNSNIYVGNVGYITPDSKVQHIGVNMLQYDNSYNNLLTYPHNRVCRYSKQYTSNTNQILKTVTMNIENAKKWCANNTNCAGFEIIDNRTVTFFKVASVR